MVQRYSFIGGPYAYADPDDKGDWVRSECYAALERERDGMQIDIVGLQSALQNQMKCVGELKEFLHNAEAANALLRKEREEKK